MADRLRDPVLLVVKKFVPLDRDFGEWLVERLKESYPDVYASAMARAGGFSNWHSVPWWFVAEDMERAEPDQRVRDDWRCACELGDALDHPMEKLAEAVQAVRKAVLALFAYADRAENPSVAAGARVVAQSLALAFACTDVMDEGYDVPAETRAWRDRLTRDEPAS